MRALTRPIGVKTIALLCKEKISIQEKQVSGIYQQYGKFASMLFFFSPFSLFSMVEGGLG